MKRFRRALSACMAAVMLTGLLTVGASAAPITFSEVNSYKQGQFTDVSASAWYADRVAECYKMGLMTGNSATTFNPAGMFTLAEASAVAARLHAAYYSTGGAQSAPGPWYQGVVNYCIQNGIYGANDFSDYTAPATRAQMAGILVNAVPESAMTAKNNVQELPDVSYGTPYMHEIFAMYNAGALSGSDAYGTFQPYAYITRAEVATILTSIAQPALRKTLNLTPLSEREMVVIPGYTADIHGDGDMSNGLIRFQDPTSKLWGFMRGNGSVAIPAQYTVVGDFQDGYAQVQKNGKWGMVSTSGAVTVSIENENFFEQKLNINGTIYHLTMAQKGGGGNYALVVNGKLVTDYLYTASWNNTYNPEQGIYILEKGSWTGAVNKYGAVVLPFAEYNTVRDTGRYLIAQKKDGTAELYSYEGKKLNSINGWVNISYDSNLLKVKEGSKYALATEQGKITEALYDDIEISGDLAILRSGSATGLAGPNGMIFELGEYQIDQVKDGFAIAYDPETKEYRIADVTGIVSEPVEYNRYKSTYFHVCDHVVFGSKFAYDRTSGETYAGNWVYGNTHFEGDGVYYLNDGTAVQWAEKKELPRFTNQMSAVFSVFMDFDGKYGVALGSKILAEAKYDTAEEAIAAGRLYTVYKSDGTLRVGYCTADEELYDVIEGYRPGIAYDRIEDVGEGYYACLFNQTWYLLHI